MTGDLIYELLAAQDALTGADRARLAAAGIPGELVSAGLIGAAPITVRPGGDIFDFDAHGRRAFIIAARVDDPLGPESTESELAAEFGTVVDLVAIHPARPDRWATRRGAATWLGAIEPQFFDPPPVRVYRTPLSWLQGGARGLCPLTRNPLEIRSLLLGCRQIEGEDLDHAKDLRRMLERPFSIPTITAPRRCRAVAA